MKAILAAAALAVFCTFSSGGAQASNSAREYVKAREAAHIARLFGNEAARAFLKTARIVGGKEALPGRWPAQVALLERGAGNNFNSQFCAGTLVGRRFVVTAAHCSDFVGPGDVWVLTGTQSLVDGGTRRAVRKITIHPNYNDETLAFDIAVWELTANVPGITPAKMITAAQEATLAAGGTGAVVTGWGLTSDGGNPSKVLRQVSVPILSRSVCTDAYRRDFTASMICAGAVGKDSCQGDSGGPLWVKDTAGQYKMVAGITSWGFDCADPDFPGVYARLAHPKMSAWVRQVIANAL